MVMSDYNKIKEDADRLNGLGVLFGSDTDVSVQIGGAEDAIGRKLRQMRREDGFEQDLVVASSDWYSVYVGSGRDNDYAEARADLARILEQYA